MGDHVLLKWASEDKWDVYPVRNIKSQTVVCQLVDDPKYVTMLTNQTVQVLWQDDEYAAAYILGIDIKKMAKNLRKATSQLADAVSSVASPAPVTVPAAQVDIGDGVLLDKKLLERISLSTPTQPSKFARALLRAVFTVEELENSSLKGKVCPANNDAPPKKALDKRSLDAVVCKDT
ncbi:hypothetical protein HPB52_013174 [Rhipicephalus sanguineus]|uniref:BEN domain-containing protein n=1 Tax=Rhipicephalus sanguineus TaxID=34632 RepID=A0A9D4PKT2_RHISA|nr:hypothetical protein HPB52_013174 [Rhipicephalus sanguineus]